MSTGYRVEPAVLAAAAQRLRDLRTRLLDELAGQLAGEQVPVTAWGQVRESGQAAEDYRELIRNALATDDAARSRATVIATGIASSATGYVDADDTVAEWYQALRQELSAPPGTASQTNVASGPWAQAIIDNRAKIARALATQEQRLDRLQQAGGPQDQIADAQARIKLFTSLLDDNRQVIVFDDSGNGRIAELFGHIDSSTKNVGIFVPGTHAGMANHQAYADLGASFVNQDANHGLAMVVYSDGRNPQNLLTQSPFPEYAHAVGPDLAAFTASTRAEIGANAPGAALTVAGHSYGSADVGAARLSHGFTADRILSVEGAGVGPGIHTPADLPADQRSVPMYSMTASDDPISLVQGGLSPLGADPDTFGNTIDLDPGVVASSGTFLGYDYHAHMNVLTPYSDAWWNMYHVFEGEQPKVLAR